MQSRNTSERSPAGFPETADIETSSDEYATRFSGTAGQWMLKVQEQITLQLLAQDRVEAKTERILDVGGGHGQLAIPLSANGYKVTVLGSAESCRHRIAAIVDAGQCRFRVGNVIKLPFSDKAFDAVVCFRLLTHCEQWPRLVAELCRVARTTVVADYPTSQSVNMMAPALFNAKKKMEGNTRSWKLFRHQEVMDEFQRQGFCLQRRKGQFFLPMVLHRMLKNATASAALEGICRRVGFTALWGSPVIVRMNRQPKSPPATR